MTQSDSPAGHSEDRPSLVSVVVPAYNAARFLGRCLASVEGQTYRNWEVIVVNDGSTDSTGAIAESFRAKHPDRVQVVTTTNRGLSSARNSGIEIARGQYIAFLDSDDLWMPRKLEVQVAILEANPRALGVSCSFVRFDSEHPTRAALHGFTWSEDAVLRWLLLEGTGPALGSTLLIRLSTVALIGTFDAELGSHAEDLDYARRLSVAGEVDSCSDILVAIRVWGGQIHRNDIAMEISLTRVFSKHLPPSSDLANRALANLEILMCVRQVSRGHFGTGLRRLSRSLVLSPASTVFAPWQMARRRRGSKLVKVELMGELSFLLSS